MLQQRAACRAVVLGVEIRNERQTHEHAIGTGFVDQPREILQHLCVVAFRVAAVDIGVGVLDVHNKAVEDVGGCLDGGEGDVQRAFGI